MDFLDNLAKKLDKMAIRMAAFDLSDIVQDLQPDFSTKPFK